MQYNAVLLSESYPNGRSSGSLETMPGSLVFKDNDNKIVKLPSNGIEMRIGGAGNRFVFFTHPKHPGICIYTDDKKVLKSDDIRFEHGLQDVIKRINRRKRNIRITLFSIAGLFIAGIVALFVLRGKIVEHIAALVPPEKERAIAQQMLESALAGKTVLNDSSIMLRLDSITRPLITALDDTAFRFSFTIIKDETLNAFALPGGAVVIHSGLIEKAENPEEVAGVLAHEISHVSRRHHLRGIIGNMGIFLIIRGLLGDVAGLSGDIATAGATLSSLKYSRDFETEADENGYNLLQKARIPTSGMISFFEKLGKEGGDMGNADFLSTHPATGNRIEHLKTMKADPADSKKLQMHFDHFKSEINTYFKSKS